MNPNISNRKDIPITILFPNIVTLIGLCFGMSSLKYSLDNRWELSVSLLVISAFIDGMDGRLARLLNASSKFGAELDSLTDFVNFGVVPAFILYLWSLSTLSIKGLGWAISLLYIICCAIRLAKFNILLQTPSDNKQFFYGINAPCAAGLSLIPIMLSFQYEIFIFQTKPFLLALYMLILSLLMVSNIHTISVKHLKLPNRLILPSLLLIIIFIIALIIEPWITLPIIGILYIISIPITMLYGSKEHNNKS